MIVAIDTKSKGSQSILSLMIEKKNKRFHFVRNKMTEQALINPPVVPVNDIDQIKVNVGTGDNNLRNVAIPGRVKFEQMK